MLFSFSFFFVPWPVSGRGASMGKSRAMFYLFFFWLFFGHEDYGMPFSAAVFSVLSVTSSWLIANVDVGCGVLVVVWFVVSMSGTTLS
jgi:hypothetical protein